MSDLKRIKRDPLRFDVFDAFSLAGVNSFRNAGAVEDFLAAARKSVTSSLEDDGFLYGQRTQNMFEAVVVALGRIRLIKSEDAGGGWFDADSLKVPDFRVIMDSGDQFLVEVKNHHVSDPIKTPLSMTAAYFNSLKRYGEWVGSSVRLAVYWSGMNLWTICPLDKLTMRRNRYELHFVDAMKANAMSAFGDLMVGTTPPLTIHLIADRREPREIHGQQAIMTFGAVKIFCAGRELLDPTARRIAQTLMMFGDWEEADPILVVDEDGLPSHCVYESTASDDDSRGFVMIGHLSGLYSKLFVLSTVEDGQVAQIRTAVNPGSFGRLIPPDFKDDALPLWLFSIQPS